jgi:hypothetical protein
MGEGEKMKRNHCIVLFLAVFAVLAISRVGARQTQTQKQNQTQNAPPAKSDVPGMGMGDTQHDSAANSQTALSANEQMSDMHMEMGPHMRMTDLRKPSAVDEERAEQILETLRPAIEQYKDYHRALDDGFQIFHPELPQDHYHFTNYRYAAEAQFVFNPAHPTSLLYKKVSDGYQLEGAMYTAPKRFTEEQLNERVPLSVARWHEHVNFCLWPKGERITLANWKEFGLKGSIATEDACEAAGGRWIPLVFNWMVHVYPYETDPAKIWAH